MEIYLDNSSTTKVCLPAAEKVMECMTVVYGNPSSLHSMGFAAEKEMTNWGKRKRDYFYLRGNRSK